MTGYTPPPGQGYGADQANLRHRVEMLERQIAQLTSGPVAVLSTGRPATPVIGQQILETDTGLTAQWNGTAWVYPPQRIAQKVLTVSQSSIVFSVPANPAFSTLQVSWTARSDFANTATYMCVQLNGDSGSHYLWQINQANNASTAGSGNPGALTTLIHIGTMAAATATASLFGNGEFVLPNASGTSTYKLASGHATSFNAVNNAYAGAYGGIWENTAAITSVTLFAESGNLVAGSSAFLYGMP